MNPWAVVAPLLPPPRCDKLKPRRPRVPDRAALAGILIVLKTGIPWEYLPQEMGCKADRIDWSRASIDTASVPAKGGARDQAVAEEIGANPTDRPQIGQQAPCGGQPARRLPSGSRRPISTTVSCGRPGVDAIEPIHRPRRQAGRPRRRPDKLHADKA